MKKEKLLSIIMAVSVAVGVLSSCGSGEDDRSDKEITIKDKNSVASNADSESNSTSDAGQVVSQFARPNENDTDATKKPDNEYDLNSIKWNNLNNGGYVAETDNYVYMIDSEFTWDSYRYNKNTDEIQKWFLGNSQLSDEGFYADLTNLCADEEDLYALAHKDYSDWTDNRSDCIVKVFDAMGESEIVFEAKDCFDSLGLIENENNPVYILTYAVNKGKMLVEAFELLGDIYWIEVNLSDNEYKLLPKIESSGDFVYHYNPHLILCTDDGKWIYGQIAEEPLTYCYDPITGDNKEITVTNNKSDIYDTYVTISDDTIYTFSWDESKYYKYNINTGELTENSFYLVETEDKWLDYIHKTAYCNGEIYFSTYRSVYRFAEEQTTFVDRIEDEVAGMPTGFGVGGGYLWSVINNKIARFQPNKTSNAVVIEGEDCIGEPYKYS